MVRRPAILGLFPLLLFACGRGDGPRKDAPAAGDTGEPTPREAAAPAEKLPTALPETRPSPFEAEYHVGSPTGGDLVTVKLSDKGASHTLGDPEHRVVIGYDVPEAELDRVYSALRAAAFDRIETRPTRERTPHGTSIRLLAGTVRHSVADLGNVVPEDAWTAEYDAASRALESVLPGPARSPAATIEVRWDGSMKGRRATVALALGPDFAGASKVSSTSGDVRVGLSSRRKVPATLRSGSPPTSTDLELDPAVHGGVEVAFDEEAGRAIVRPLRADTAASATSAARHDGKAPAPP